MTFGERVKSLLEYQGKTLTDLANALNTRPTTINGWIKRGSIPSADTALIVAEFLDVSIEYLIYGKNKRSSNSMDIDPEEKKLLYAYNQLSEKDQNTVLAVAESLRDYGKKAVSEGRKETE